MADSRLSTVPSWLPVGMDPLTTYLLEIKLAGDQKNARVKYDWFIFNKMIDSNAMCYKDFVDDIAKSYPWGPNETVTIGYVDMVHKISHHVTTDQDMLEMFEKFVDIKVIPMIIRIHGMNENIDELDHTLVKANICVPDTPSLATPSQVDFSQPSSSTLPSHVLMPSDTYLINPFPMAEHVDNEEAVAGQADETRGEGAANEESEDESWATSEDTSEDASEGDGVDESEDESMALDGMPENIPSATYDKNDPPMIVGSIYPNIDEFRLAIAQHAIKKEFEFNIIRSEPGQYTAKCAAQGCNWRIHASVVADGVTMIVKTNPFPHECSSTRRSETIKATSKFWICEKVKDWLLEDASVGAKELQRRIHETHKVKINYKRVHAEHRECMKHMVTNFKKKFTGKIFDDNLWPAAYAWSPYFYEKHMAAMEEAKPEAVAYLRKYHKRLWSRSQFSTVCKVDYVTNNLAESFNNLVKDWKALHLYDFLERIRRWLLIALRKEAKGVGDTNAQFARAMAIIGTIAKRVIQSKGPPKKRRKKTNEVTSETSIMAAPIVTPIMTYPPSQSIHFIEDSRTRNNSSSSSRSVRSRSLTGSNQPEPSNMIAAMPCLGEQTPPVAPKKAKSKTKGKPPCSARKLMSL
ncbi:Os03g0845100 [Oryza sativa Japonica Group]|uniref:Os03g0845100 protein n=1 Tax=Oryza sativa subsp. japonica TaxID=39947 RepID=C7J035_ORYSJ|nr:Os03g0845100 [Oryza sativa Japonica Group]|eukprot:NP_001173712.1 Os03g0845100 [Oryza sativa Japonica Group]